LPVSRIDIFRYNWHAKLISGISNNDYPATLTNYILTYIDKHNYSDETNYYAVEFESLSALYNKLQESPDYKLQESPDYKLIEQKIGLLLTDLEKRRTKDGLYQFKNSESRLDITCHVLNGFYSLLENSSR